MTIGALRGLQVLEAMAGMAQPVSLETVTAAMGLSQSQAFRSLQALEQAGYVDHVGRSGYRLGARALALASLVAPRPALLRVVQPVMAHLAAGTGLAAGMSVRSGEHRVLVMSVPGPDERLRGVFAQGERSPLTVGSAGRVILAHLPEAEIAPAYRRSSAKIREQGWVASFAENHPGFTSVSMALLDPETAQPLGSLTVAGADSMLSAAGIRDHVPVLRSAADALAPRLAVLIGPTSSAPLTALDLV